MVEGDVSLPSRLGQLTSNLFEEYPIYSYSLSPDVIAEYLPDRLKSFSTRTLVNHFKRRFFYSQLTLVACRSQLSSSLPLELTLEEVLPDLLRLSSFDRRYNFVLTNNSLIFVRIPRSRHVSFHLLCKHLIVANRPDDVRFAGEFWKDGENIRVNNNSGTYRPANHLIQPMIKLLRRSAPALDFQGVSFQASQRPALQSRINKKIQRKCHLH